MTSAVRVLVVDDEPDIRVLTTEVLHLLGYDPVGVSDGRAALAFLDRCEQLPRLVILDVQMPDFDGWEVLRRIRSRQRTADLPVLLCTVKAAPADLERGFELGCNGYLTKPFDLDAIEAAVRAVIRGEACTGYPADGQ